MLYTQRELIFLIFSRPHSLTLRALLWNRYKLKIALQNVNDLMYLRPETETV